MAELELDSLSICKLLSSLVHKSVGVALIPSCVDAEQVNVRGCPAITELLKGTMLTAGGEGAVCVFVQVRGRD